MKGISIHAPAWGATPSGGATRPPSAYFNPRARVGRDRRRRASRKAGCDFNPRARVGRDLMEETNEAIQKDFNPRARVGRDSSLFA